MIQTPMDVLREFPVRKSKKQKQAFREAVQSYAEKLGYQTEIEKGSFGSRNIIIGNRETAKYLVTAHYDTPAGMWVPNLMTPCNPVVFVLTQLLITAAVLIPSIVLTLGAAWLFQDRMVWYPVMLISMYGTIILMMAGPANPYNANDNTSGVVTVLETAAYMPENLREQVCFVLFDLEELGLVGSSSYRKKNRRTSDRQIVVNLDCVGDGDTIMFFPGKGMKKDARKMRRLMSLQRSWGGKQVVVRHKGFAFFPSDQMHFPVGIGICALHKNLICHYCDRIHTFRDTILDHTNVSILRNCLIEFIGGAAEE